MSEDIYKGLLSDMIREINELTENPSIWEDSEFNRGYRAGMMVVMKAIEDEIFAFDLPKNGEIPNLIDVGEWFRKGKVTR